MASVHVVKCYDGEASEEDWYRFLLEPLGMVEHASPDFSVQTDHAIYAVIGTRGLGHIPARFLDGLSRVQCKGLLHLGDEFLAGGYELYRHFDFVIRNHYAAALSVDGAMTIPLGYPNGMASSGDEAVASKRPLAWCFLGNLNAARADMIAEFRRLAPNFLYTYRVRNGEQPVRRDEYKAILGSSAFLPCPMGNVMLETWRLYEGLEAGAIPLLSRRALMPYHDRVMPNHPIPTFKTWATARRFAERLLSDKPALDALQSQVLAWWKTHKGAIQADLCHFISMGFDGAFRESLGQYQPLTGIRLQTWRVLELLKHHDLVALGGRLKLESAKLAQRIGTTA